MKKIFYKLSEVFIDHPSDVTSIDKISKNFVESNCDIYTDYARCINQAEYTDILCFIGNNELNLILDDNVNPSYLASIIKVCAMNGVDLKLHYPDGQCHYIF